MKNNYLKIMDGKYLIDSLNIIENLNSWGNNIVINNLWDKFDHIHIDQLDINLKNKETWIDGSIFIFKNLFDFIDYKENVVLLAIPIPCSKEKKGTKILSLNDLNEYLDYESPSFYLFRINDENLRQTIDEATFNPTLSDITGLNVYFTEKMIEDEYCGIFYFLK